MASIHLSETSWCPGHDAHDVDSPDYKGAGEINRPKMIFMLCCLLLEELTVLAFGDDLHHVILSCKPVETVSESFDYDRAPLKMICMLRCLLLEELTVLSFGDDLHRVILSCKPVETMSESFAYDRAP
jgi:hypothetical protein